MKPYTLFHVDSWVDDYTSTMDTLAKAYGFPAETFFADLPAFGAWMASISLGSAGYSSTGFCLMGTGDLPGIDRSRPDYPYLVESSSLPPLRPGRFHSTSIMVNDLGPYLERLDRNGVRYRLDQPVVELPAYRLWVGWGADKADPWYQPGFDSGLKLEFWTMQDDAAPGMPGEDAPSPAAAEGESGQPGTGQSAADILGIESKSLLVRDLRAATSVLERNFDWAPDRTWSKDGVSVAEFGFEDPLSAVIQLVSPYDAESPLARVLGDWDHAPSFIRVACSDLDAREDALREVGLRPERGTASDGSGRAAMRVPAAVGGPGLFEFAEPRA